MAEEAKHLAKEIRKEQEVQQWAGIPHEHLLNQSFTDQLSCIQTLETLAPLKLAKQHLPEDIIDILERLGKADNIPFNQLYSIVENCADQYYTNIIKAFTVIIKRQFTDHQILLVNTARVLKFLKEYADRQVQLWKILQVYHDVPDQIAGTHTHFNQLKSTLQTHERSYSQKQSQPLHQSQPSAGILPH